jgi:hypothetical protein
VLDVSGAAAEAADESECDATGEREYVESGGGVCNTRFF